MDKQKFLEIAKEYNFIPVYEKITADLLTPVLAYLKLRKPERQSFLLESVEGIESRGRYSFIGIDPEKIFSNSGYQLKVKRNGECKEYSKSIFDLVKEELHNKKHPVIDELPSFTGGIVGYLGYENISLIEPVLEFERSKPANPDSILGLYETIIAFDHYKHQLILITNICLSDFTTPEKAFDAAKQKLKDIREELGRPFSFKSDFRLTGEIAENISDEDFHRIVELSKRNIIEGDIFQIVLSKRFSAPYEGDLFNVYRALRIINPSPYMYFLNFKGDFYVIGTSPENLVKVKDGIAEVLPIAGTRKRGKNAEEDKRLEENLINDPKEIAEHVMLLDLGRNDLGRVCEYDSVKVIEQMRVQKYSHVMHMVSKVHGKVASDKDCIDTLKACFPAGTVTGAPKIRAMQLIKEYEAINRNVYAGAVGYFDFSGNLDMCLAIRTLFADKEVVSWQAGAGIVADSIPRLESKEINNKSAAIRNALEYAEGIDEDISY